MGREKIIKNYIKRKFFKGNLLLNGGLTLIELLIVVGILAILTTALVFFLNPAQIIAQSRDSTRMNDLQTFKKAIDISKAMGSFVDSTEAKMVYISLPDTNSVFNDDCRASGEYPTLPILAAGWEYRCAANSSNLRKVDGAGWIPINFASVLSIQPPLVVLPIDPLNNSATLNYYTYSRDADPNIYALAAKLDSEKYLSDSAAKDGGNDDFAFETRPILWKGSGAVLEESFTSTTFPPITCNGGWTTGGNANWARDTVNFDTSPASAVAPASIIDNQSSWIDCNITLASNSTLTFRWKVSSESGYDFLNYCEDIDATCSRTVKTLGISGTGVTTFAQITRNLSAGTHSLRWLYAKDGSVSTGSDVGWLDTIQIIEAP